MNVDNIRLVAETIRSKEHLVSSNYHSIEPFSGFTMSNFALGSEASCKTPGCIAGWASFLANPVDFYCDVDSKASEFLGLGSSLDDLYLFYPRLTADMFTGVEDSEFEVRFETGEKNWRPVFGVRWEKITPEEAVVALEKFIETGKVNWSHLSWESVTYDYMLDVDSDAGKKFDIYAMARDGSKEIKVFSSSN